MMDATIPIFLIHGLGANPVTLWPLQCWLQIVGGFTHVYRPWYAASHLSLAEAVDAISIFIDSKITDRTQPIAVLGQSFGGLVANRLHARGFHVVKAVYLVSPLHGARLLTQVETRIPVWLRNWLYKKPYADLQHKDREAVPPHPYHTISVGLPGWGAFDGNVYRDEACLDPQHHTHLPWHHHALMIANPVVWRACLRELAVGA